MAERMIERGGEGEITEKKSRFIAAVRPIKTEEEALSFVQERRKLHWNARHHCYAYVLGRNQEIMRFSDDGEPGGTAGKPMLEVLLREEIHNAVVVVTRYFGGILLGAGGLLRAYQSAVRAGLGACVILEKTAGIRGEIVTDYTGLGRIQYLMRTMEVTELETRSTDCVTVTYLIRAAEAPAFAAKILDATAGQARVAAGEPVACAEVEGRLVLLSEEAEEGKNND